MQETLKAPFPYFGGKASVADIVWSRFGDVKNYVEPFAGSLAVLLARPTEPKTETVNDKDCFLANFWRALQADPEQVAHYADWPVNECDLEARHRWLVNQDGFIERMKREPEYYDCKIAGWWAWGLCCWIGSGWCKFQNPWLQIPHLGNAGQGVHRKRPHLGNAGRGVHRKRPHLGNAGRGVHQQLPNLGNAGQGVEGYFISLAERLRRVRVCCGDWQRVLGPSVTFKHGLTGIFLDPPYTAKAGRDGSLYCEDDLNIGHDVAAWAIANGDNPLLRIALCGYEGEYDMPKDWECFAWKASGGYSSQNSRGNDNSHKERIWFSPYCIGRQQADLFDGVQQ